MSNLGKVVIAHSVLASLAITDRLDALGVAYDETLAGSVVDLADNLAKVMIAVEILDQGVAAVIGLLEKGNVAEALVGLNMIKEGTAQLVSEQETIDAAMGIDPMQRAIQELLQALAGK